MITDFRQDGDDDIIHFGVFNNSMEFTDFTSDISEIWVLQIGDVTYLYSDQSHIQSIDSQALAILEEYYTGKSDHSQYVRGDRA